MGAFWRKEQTQEAIESSPARTWQIATTYSYVGVETWIAIARTMHEEYYILYKNGLHLEETTYMPTTPQRSCSRRQSTLCQRHHRQHCHDRTQIDPQRAQAAQNGKTCGTSWKETHSNCGVEKWWTRIHPSRSSWSMARTLCWDGGRQWNYSCSTASTPTSLRQVGGDGSQRPSEHLWVGKCFETLYSWKIDGIRRASARVDASISTANGRFGVASVCKTECFLLRKPPTQRRFSGCCV